uniref:Ycf2 n=1 Tax=Pinus wangii TaxID=252738 RepID=A0A346PZC4_9CONI|nr:ycf2 [Pinus wangii]AXR86100.1 ycf2 [Pinus wangii]
MIYGRSKHILKLKILPQIMLFHQIPDGIFLTYCTTIFDRKQKKLFWK